MFKQLPIFVVDGVHVLNQSDAILRYIAGSAVMLLNDLIANAKLDTVLEEGQEMFAPLNPIVNVAKGETILKNHKHSRENSSQKSMILNAF